MGDRHLIVCDSCGREADRAKLPTNWLYMTQPTKILCDVCKKSGTNKETHTMTGEQYDADYFLHGKQSGKSLYEDYRWMPELTIPMVDTIIRHLGISKSDSILDFGCARGYTVKALRQCEHKAYGIDISEWAIQNCDPDVKEHLYHGELTSAPYSWIIAKDVLEHIYFVGYTIDDLMQCATKGILAVVPLSAFDGGEYVIQDYEKDTTHCQRHPIDTWMNMFLKVGWKVEVSYRIPGIKDNYYRPGWEKGNGFITTRRLT